MYDSDVKHPNPTLEDKLHALYRLSPDKKIDLSFRPPFMALLEKMGNPHLKMPPCIHVAGTNGKGSTIAFLKSILEAAGYRVHVCTSPHLIRFNERIVLAGKQIEDEPLESLIDEVMAANGNNNITFFEAKTVITFTAFSRTPADICLIEVGMGGRLDCTNVIQNPLATVISRISMDHAEFLGDTLAKIAGEKAGIIKPDTPCITAEQEPEALDVIKTKAAQENAPFTVTAPSSDTYTLSLTGEHQRENAGLAIETLKSLPETFKITPAHIESGLKAARWPARLQALPAQAYGLNDQWEIWLDGGHNEDAGRILSVQAKEWTDKPLYVITGMMKHKDPKEFLEHLLPHTENLYTINIEGEPAAMNAEDLSALFPSAIPAQNYSAAIKDIASQRPPGRILICGSLYLAGHVLQALEK